LHEKQAKSFYFFTLKIIHYRYVYCIFY